tara:strand:+ start:1156 stop:1716 length:561 start_codon:yes stop_codon:yes gene_type:complete
MAALNGLTPSRQPVADWIRNLPAAANTNGAGQTIAKGDAVAYVNGVIVPASAGQDPTHPGFGVVLAVYTTANRPFTFQTNKIIVSGAVGRVDVCFDPNQTYIVRCDTSAGPSNLGKNAVLAVSAANAVTGISGHSVNIPASSSINDLFKIINISPFDELAGKGTGGGANNGVEVKWNRHLLHAATA